jgi:hypothetical protein
MITTLVKEKLCLILTNLIISRFECKENFITVSCSHYLILINLATQNRFVKVAFNSGCSRVLWLQSGSDCLSKRVLLPIYLGDAIIFTYMLMRKVRGLQWSFVD